MEKKNYIKHKSIKSTNTNNMIVDMQLQSSLVHSLDYLKTKSYRKYFIIQKITSVFRLYNFKM